MSLNRNAHHAHSNPPAMQEVRGAAPRVHIAEILQRSQIVPCGRQLTDTRNRPVASLPAIADRTDDQRDQRQRITNALATEFAEQTLALARSNMDRESKRREVSHKFKAFPRELDTEIGIMTGRTVGVPAGDIGHSAVAKSAPSRSPSSTASGGAVNANAPNGRLSWRSFLGLVVVTAIAVVVLLYLLATCFPERFFG